MNPPTRRIFGILRGIPVAQVRLRNTAGRNQNGLEEHGMIHSETTVREFALQIPQSTRLFENPRSTTAAAETNPLLRLALSAGVDFDSLIEKLGEMTQPNSQDAA